MNVVSLEDLGNTSSLNILFFDVVLYHSRWGSRPSSWGLQRSSWERETDDSGWASSRFSVRLPPRIHARLRASRRRGMLLWTICGPENKNYPVETEQRAPRENSTIEGEAVATGVQGHDEGRGLHARHWEDQLQERQSSSNPDLCVRIARKRPYSLHRHVLFVVQESRRPVRMDSLIFWWIRRCLWL